MTDPRTQALAEISHGDITAALVYATLHVGDQVERLADLFEATTRDDGGGAELRTAHVAIHPGEPIGEPVR